jgi:hypothetical protein
MLGDSGNYELDSDRHVENRADGDSAVSRHHVAEQEDTPSQAAAADEGQRPAAIAQVRAELNRISSRYNHKSELRPFVDSENPGWKEYQRAYLESYLLALQLFLLALQLFNDRVLAPRGKAPLTYDQTEAMGKFKLSADVYDHETGQKWELALDRKPRSKWNESDRSGTRVTIWDHNERGNRVTSEWADKTVEQWGDVFDMGWRVTPDGV